MTIKKSTVVKHIRTGIGGYVKFSRGKACGKKVFLNLTVLLWRLENLLPDASCVKSLCFDCEGSLIMFWALVRMHFPAVFSMVEVKS